MTITELYRILTGKTKLRDATVLEMAEHGRAGGVNTGQPFKFVDGLNYAVKITEDGTSTYIGLANPGSAQGSAVWKCLKIDSSSGTVITWADGDEKFDNIATDLTALSYS